MKIGNFQNVISLLKALFKNTVILFFILFFAYFFSPIFGKFYEFFFGPEGSWLDFTALIGLPLSYTLFTSLFFTAFGDEYKYWWAGILLLPIFIFFFQADVSHIYFPIILGLVGWAIGYGLSWLLQKRAGKQN